MLAVTFLYTLDCIVDAFLEMITDHILFCISATGICLLQVRAGRPHEILASSIPFLKNIRSHKVIPRYRAKPWLNYTLLETTQSDEKIENKIFIEGDFWDIFRTIYTGATIKNCYKRILLHQKDQLRLLTPLMKTEAEKQELEAKLMQIRKFEASKDQSDMQWLVEIHITIVF